MSQNCLKSHIRVTPSNVPLGSSLLVTESLTFPRPIAEGEVIAVAYKAVKGLSMTYREISR